MSISPIEHSASLRIGAVEYVAPNEIRVSLDLDAPEDVAGNAGIPRPFPRVNSYVLIGTEEGYVVAQVEWITLQRAPSLKRKSNANSGLVDLPFPAREMRANPLGVLKNKEGEESLIFRRGVRSFPSVGAPVLLPTDTQLRAVVESGENRRVEIGTCPLASDAQVRVDPDRLFGRHLAVLGNTGSGKSCSIAGLIRWSLDAARDKHEKQLPGQGFDDTAPLDATKDKHEKQPDGKPKARFIILDPNGEYTTVFGDKAQVFQVKTNDATHSESVEECDKFLPLKVPLWLWNVSEWAAFTRATGKNAHTASASWVTFDEEWTV